MSVTDGAASDDSLFHQSCARTAAGRFAGDRAAFDIATVAPTVLHGVARGERLVAVVERPSGEQAGFAGALAVAPVDPVLGQLRLNGVPSLAVACGFWFTMWIGLLISSARTEQRSADRYRSRSDLRNPEI